MALGATFSRSPAMLPATSLPKTLWPLLKVMAPEMSSVSYRRLAYAQLPATMLLAMSSADPTDIDAAAARAIG